VACGNRRYSAFRINLQIYDFLCVAVARATHRETLVFPPDRAVCLRYRQGVRRLLLLHRNIAFAALFAALTATAADAQTAVPDDAFATNARLLASVRNDDASGIERALRDGAAVNSRNRLGESALLIALKKNRGDFAQTLLAAGADVNEAAVNGVTPLCRRSRRTRRAKAMRRS